jgi:hypothetical protein
MRFPTHYHGHPRVKTDESCMDGLLELHVREVRLHPAKLSQQPSAYPSYEPRTHDPFRTTPPDGRPAEAPAFTSSSRSVRFNSRASHVEDEMPLQQRWATPRYLVRLSLPRSPATLSGHDAVSGPLYVVAASGPETARVASKYRRWRQH